MRWLVLGLFVIAHLFTQAQRTIALKTGDNVITDVRTGSNASELPGFGGKRYGFIKFNETPGLDLREDLTREGVKLLYHAGERTYLAELADGIALDKANLKIAAAGPFDPSLKTWRVDADTDGPVDVSILCARDLNPEDVITTFREIGAVVTNSSRARAGVYTLRAGKDQLETIAALPFVFWIENAPAREELLRYYGQAQHRVNILHEAFGLSGQGVVVGVGDGGKVGPHIDLDSSVTNYASGTYSNHATHVSGIISAREYIEPLKGYGMAPGSEVLTDNFTNIIIGAEDYLRDHGMVLTNNSYGSSTNSCELFGDYNLNSVFIDEQLHRQDTLVHVFAAGNSGSRTCAPYTKGYRTILNGWQCAKNVITVGSTSHLNGISSFSSRGPVDDGRIKPEIVAHGANNASTRYTNTYATGSGTSYSAPGITGILALLYEQYRNIYGTNPRSDLVRAALFVTAEDFGRPGPDYLYGYGRVRANAANKVLRDSTFFQGQADQGDSITLALDIPDNTAEVRIMLAWSDPEGAVFSNPALVNDLDLVVYDNAMQAFEPWVLNPSPSGVTMSAFRSRDSINNQELVTISAPDAGQVTIVVKGTAVAMGPQEFSVAYEIRENAIKLTYPLGGEVLKPGRTEYIRWEKYGFADGTTMIELSLDGGQSWETLSDSESTDRLWLAWTVPETYTDSALFRVSSGGFSHTLDSAFSILDRSSAPVASIPCNGFVELSWDANPFAEHYRIYEVRPTGITLVDTSHTENSILGGLPPDASTWLAVSTVAPSGTESIRSRAIPVEASSDSLCPWPVELALAGITAPVSGRESTSTSPGPSEEIIIEVQNLGSDTIFSFDAHLSIDNGTAISESVNDTIPPGAGQAFTFTKQADLSTPGTYSIKAWVSVTGDSSPENDTARAVIRHYANPAVALPWTEDFETLHDMVITTDSMGVEGIDRFDFEVNGSPGRLRSFVTANMIPSGARALTMDGSRYSVVTDNALTVTLNLADYKADSNDVRLVFAFAHHTTFSLPGSGNALWLRGSDTDEWIFMYDLFDENLPAGKVAEFIQTFQISDSLLANGQDFTTSTQLRFTQSDDASADASTREAGYTIDDLNLFIVHDDLKMVGIENPDPVNAQLGIEEISVFIENTSPNALETDLYYSVVPGDTVFEKTTIPADTVYLHTFMQQFDFDSVGNYILQVWVNTPTDTYNDNDSITRSVIKLPVIDTFPYIEDFEAGNGGWLATGTNSTLELGEPGGKILNTAAGGNWAWVTNLTANHNNNEQTYLSSPCFDLTSINEPVLSFALAYEIEAGYDFLWVEYSEDSETWTKLNLSDSTINWYNNSSEGAWDGDRPAWQVSSASLPPGECVRVRFVFESDGGLTKEGFGLDLISIHEKVPVSSGFSSVDLSEPVSGNTWVNFISSDSIYLGMNSYGRDMGLINASVYEFDSSAVRSNGEVYLLNRNYVISGVAEPDSLFALRLYFTDDEASQLIAAQGCEDCVAARDPFHITVMQYTGPIQDSAFNNNASEYQTFINREVVRVFPYINGYYAEIEIDTFSELWITSAPVPTKDSIVIRVSSSNDDAHEFMSSGGVNPLGENLVFDPVHTVGLRFPGVMIPKGSFIADARLVLTAFNNTADSSQLLVSGLADLPVNSFNTNMRDITDRETGERQALWPVGEWLTYQDYGSVSLRSLVQESLDKAAWLPGDAVGFSITGGGGHLAYAYEGDPGYSAKLVIEFDTVCHLSGTLFVNATATGDNTGSNWENAFRDLQDALDLASHCPDISEIWVAEGDYYVSRKDRTRSFSLPPGIALYGGFNGSESSVDQRDFALHPTFLSGDLTAICGECGPAIHIVTVPATSDTVRIDGFIISGANANGTIDDDRAGAGLFAQGAVELANSAVENTESVDAGSAVYLKGENAFLILRNSIIRMSSEPAFRATGGAGVRIIDQTEIQSNE